MKKEHYILESGKVLVQIPGKHNYVTATLIADNGQSRTMGVHGFIVAAREQSWEWKHLLGLEVDHINEEKNDNRSENLELVTRIEQYTESVKRRMSDSKRGTNHPLARLDESDVMDIRQRFDEWDERKVDLIESLADEYQVSVSCINNIAYGYTWQHV